MTFPYSFPAGAVIILFPSEHHWAGNTNPDCAIPPPLLGGITLLSNHTLVGTEILSPGLEGFSSHGTPRLSARLCVWLSVWCGVYNLQDKNP